MLIIDENNDNLTIELSEECTINQVENDYLTLKDLLISKRNQRQLAISIDISKVQNIDTAYLQLILVLTADSKVKNKITIKGDSLQVKLICELYGVSINCE